MRALKLRTNDMGKGNLILVNPDHPVRHEPSQEQLVAVWDEVPHVRLERQAAKLLERATSAAGCSEHVVPVSGYRPLEEQRRLYEASLRDHGEEFTRNYVALPGCSEHQTGLAIDLGENKDDIDFICPSLPYTGMFGKLRETLLKYGFIERYPAGREHIIGIAHEPWHFRYVGYPHALIMRDNDFTLEEYTDHLRQFPYDGSHLEVNYHGRDFEMFHIPVSMESKIDIIVPAAASCQVSGNNVDGFIVTLWSGSGWRVL